MSEKEIFNAAIRVFGRQAQEEVAIEECSELIQAITHKHRGREHNIAEEVSDVEIMCEQLKIINNCASEVEKIRQQKIFEGDILSERPPMNQTAYIGYVAYDEELAVWRFMIKNNDNYNGVLLGSYSKSYKIIGNIHDNPELLKGGAE